CPLNPAAAMAAGQPAARSRPAGTRPPLCLVLRTGALVRCARHCCSLPADEAEAVFVNAAGAVAGREEVQLVDHMVVAAYEGLIDPDSSLDRQFEGSFQEPPAVTVAPKI